MRPAIYAQDAQNQDTHREELHLVLIARFEKCPYCHSKLLFTHDLNLEHFEVTENGRCSGCGMHTSPRKHTLQ
jgi:hypothetical protein